MPVNIRSQNGIRRYLDKYSFLVLGAPFAADPGFTTCSEIQESSEVVESRMGGSLYPVKNLGLASTEDVTLERPATFNNLDLLAWYRMAVDGSLAVTRKEGGARGIGFEPDYYKHDITIMHIDRATRHLRGWKLVDAFPRQVTMADGFDNNANERTMERIVLVVDYIQPVDPTEKYDIKLFANTPFANLFADLKNGTGTVGTEQVSAMIGS